MCDVILPNWRMYPLGKCSGTFPYSSNSTQSVTIYVTYRNSNSSSYFVRMWSKVDFSKWTWWSSNVISSASNSYSSPTTNYGDKIELSTDRKSPSTSQYVNLTIKTDKNYTGKLTFSMKYRSSSSSSWSSVSNTSSTYVSDYSSDWSNGYYKMTSSDKGQATLNNLIKFKKSGYYRVYVKDTAWNESYIQFDVDTSSSSSSSNDKIELSTNRKSPSTSQYVNLTIKTDKNYTGKLTLSAKYRKSSSDSWSSISNTSSTYFYSTSDEWDDGYYKMTSSNKWQVTLGDLVKFKKSGYYRIYVKDTAWNESYIQFDVDTAGSYSDNNELKVTASPSNPDTYEWVKLTIKTDPDYDARIRFPKFQYRSSTSSSWSDISNITSSTYVYDYSSAWSDDYFRLVSDEDGETILKNLVKFKKSGYYKIYVEDTAGNESYVQISVDVSSSSNNSHNDDLEVTASPSNPDTYEWVKLNVTTDDDYTGKITFSRLQYRSSSSVSWSDISRTSSSYVSDYSSAWSNGYYKMTSSDDGEVVFKNLVKFKKSGYYRIYVEDFDGNESYVQINVDTSDSSSSNGDDEIELSTNRKSPSTSQYIDLTIETDDDYTGKLNLSAKYRKSSSDSWSSISNTSSTYFSDYSDEWDDGYYRMRSSDDGEVTLEDLVKFRKSWYYRIYVEDTDGNESYIQFSVDVDDDDDDDKSSSSSVNWFSSSELAKVKSVYKEWYNMVAQMQKKYPSLKKDTYWIKLSENLYKDMKDVIDNKKYRDLDDYDDFKEAFDDWYKYTIRNI